MCYYGYNGFKYPDGPYEGDGFKEGDVVEVQVSRSNNTVKYFANGILKATHQHQMLGDIDRVFTPFI